MTKRFQEKVVLVTGGARGIGRAIADRFGREGAVVYALDKAHGEGESSGAEKATPLEGDVTDAGDVRRSVGEIVAKRGRIDVLVNNAGIVRDNMIWKMPEEDFDAVVAVNLKGAWLVSREVAPVMRRQESGRIIQIASRAWLGNRGQSNYAASKAGLVGLTRVLALELARSGVTVNAVAPGLIDTPMTRALPEAVYRKLLAHQPLGRAGTPEEIAAVVAFLASDDAAFLSGQVIHVDGGRSIGAAVQ